MQKLAFEMFMLVLGIGQAETRPPDGGPAMHGGPRNFRMKLDAIGVIIKHHGLVLINLTGCQPHRTRGQAEAFPVPVINIRRPRP